MTEDQLMKIMKSTSAIPSQKPRQGKKKRKVIRTIYEAGRGPELKPSGRFFMDFASYDGTGEQVPKVLIDRLEAEGKLVRAFPKTPEINAWILAENVEAQS